MNIVSLTAENIKKVKAVHIEPNGNTILVTGKNGQGKSSVLDSIVYALGGKKALDKMPIRNGEEKAKVELDLGQFVVTRTFTAKDSYLEIKNKDGFKASSPQALLDQIVGSISFDPLQFVNEPDSRVQRKILLGLVGVNTSELDQDKQKMIEDRKPVTREINRLKIDIDRLPTPEGDMPDEAICISDLVKELEMASEINAKANALEDDIVDKEDDIQKLMIKIGDLEAKLHAAKDLLGTRHKEAKELIKERTNLTRIDVEPIKERMRIAEETNKKVRERDYYYEISNDLAAHKTRYRGMTEAISNIEQAKQKMLARAEMPIEGLSVNDTDVLYNGIPISQISDSEKLRVGIAVSMARNPKLKVLRIKDGSLLDEDNLAMISEMIESNDYQIWIERVDSSGKVGIVIEDGCVKGSEQAETSPAQKSEDKDTITQGA